MVDQVICSQYIIKLHFQERNYSAISFTFFMTIGASNPFSHRRTEEIKFDKAEFNYWEVRELCHELWFSWPSSGKQNASKWVIKWQGKIWTLLSLTLENILPILIPAFSFSIIGNTISLIQTILQSTYSLCSF